MRGFLLLQMLVYSFMNIRSPQAYKDLDFVSEMFNFYLITSQDLHMFHFISITFFLVKMTCRISEDKNYLEKELYTNNGDK